jgi:hypothetical protein
LARIIRLPAKINVEVVPRRPTQFLQSAPERRCLLLTFNVIHGAANQHANTPHPLLSVRCERPYSRRPNKSCDELAPS